MCSRCQTLKAADLLAKKFGAAEPAPIGKYDRWPRYQGVFVRRPVGHHAGFEAAVGRVISGMPTQDMTPYTWPPVRLRYQL